MSGIVRRLEWDRQPQSGASANLGHPVLRGLSFLWSAAQDKAEVTRSIAPSGYWTTPVFITPTPFGLAGRNAATAATRFDATKFPASTEYTYLAFVLDDAGRGSTRNFFDSDDGGSARIFQFRCTSSNTVEFIAFNTSGGNSSGFTTSATTSSTAPQVIAARSNGDGSLDLFIDGAGKTTAFILLGTTVRTNSEAGAKYSIGGGAWDGAPFPGGVFWAAGWSRALSDAEIKYISAHPWQLFEPEQVYVPFASGGATDYPVTATDALTLADSASQAFAATGVAADAMTLADSASNVASLGASGTAALTLADSASNVAALSATATDALTLADTLNATASGDYTAIGSDALTLADTLNATASGDYTATSSDALTLADAASNVAVLGATASDALTLADAASNVAAFIATITEAMTLADTSNGSTTGMFTATITESMFLADTLLAAGGSPASFWTQISTTQVAGWGQTDNTQSSGWTIIPTT